LFLARLKIEISEAWVRIENSIDVTLLVRDLLAYKEIFAMIFFCAFR